MPTETNDGEARGPEEPQSEERPRERSDQSKGENDGGESKDQGEKSKDEGEEETETGSKPEDTEEKGSEAPEEPEEEPMKQLERMTAELREIMDSASGREAALNLVREAAALFGADTKNPGGHQWKGPLPKGWTDESRRKFWDSLTGRAPKHKVTQCIKRMKGKVGDPGAFCAALADRETPGWRAEAAKERKKSAALGLVHEAAILMGRPLRTRRDYGERSPSPTKESPHSELPTEDETRKS